MRFEGEQYANPAKAPGKVAVVGAGSWGTALALHSARAGHEVSLWGRDAARIDAIRRDRTNARYLPDAILPASVVATTDAEEALAGARFVISVVPSRHTRDLWVGMRQSLPADAHLISATKGIEQQSGLRISEVLGDVLNGAFASVSSLSGPSFAAELAEGHPTAVALGCTEPTAAREVQQAMSAGALRVYRNGDLVGVEMGGALKNVIAIAAGIVDGLGFGSNTQAALISRGLKEMTALATACGAAPATLMGLAGLGDLVLTCTGPLSRNRSLGVEIARGKSLDEAVASMSMVAEGAVTTRSTHALAKRLGVEMPISEGVYAVLYDGLDPRSGIEQLLARALVEEWES